MCYICKKVDCSARRVESNCLLIKLLNKVQWMLSFLFLFLNWNICCGYSKEPSPWDGSFEHLKRILKLMGKDIIYLQFYAQNVVYLDLCANLKIQEKLKNVAYLDHCIYFVSFVVPGMYHDGDTWSLTMALQTAWPCYGTKFNIFLFPL